MQRSRAEYPNNMNQQTRENWRQRDGSQAEGNENDFKYIGRRINDERYRNMEPINNDMSRENWRQRDGKQQENYFRNRGRGTNDERYINDGVSHQARERWRQEYRSQEERNENDFRNRGRRRNDESYRSTGQVYDSERNNDDMTHQTREQRSSQEERNETNYRSNHRGEYRSTSRARNSEHNNERMVPKRMGFKLAEKLGDNENIEEVVQEIFNDRAGFKVLLKDNDLSGDFLVLIVHILSKVSKSSFPHTKMHIYESVFMNSTYIKQLKAFITSSPFQDENEKKTNSYFWRNSDQFWYNLEEIFKDLTTTPSLASQVLPKLLESIVKTLPNFENENIHISDDIKKKFLVLQEKISNIESDMKEKYHSREQQAHNDSSENEDDQIPPNDFRMINVYPDILEVATKHEPFLRRNKIVGSYQNVDHYLDVQFRLLREDFISPLRRGICQYLENSNVKHYEDMKIHPKIHFLSEENVNELKCFRIRFDFKQEKKSLKYEDSKQFMFGSLVCFSNNRFVTVIFGKIVKRDPEMMKNGELIVGFDDYENVVINYYSDYIMVESTVYFEPYFHVLKVLQKITEKDFPFKRYIVQAKSEVYFPNYIDNSTVFTIDKRLIYPMNWHDQYRLYSLDDSQEQALRASLTREISIIQGPPGTGKTFLGLKIAHILLTNKDRWYNNTPLLVICFTNHALDQFLEGILTSTKKLLRIGGQSKSPVLQNYNLKNKKRQRSQAFYQAQRELTLSLNDLKAFDNVIHQIGKYNTVLDFTFFRNTLEDIEGTWFQTANTEDIKNWLFENANTHRTTPPIPVSNSILPPKESDPASDDELSNYEDEAEEEEVDEIFTNITISISDGSSNGSIKQTYAVKPLISLQSLENKIKEAEKDEDDPLKMMLQSTKIKTDLTTLRNEYAYLQQNLEQLKNGTHYQRYILRKKPFQMTMNERWALYHHFLKQFLHYLMKERKVVNDLYQEKYKIYTEQKDIEDVKAMRESLIIGMTTTSAARLHPVLQALKSPIVIVEEAAEVLEAHIITALTVHCKQLILLGDHQQLRPTTADYTVETEYQMGVSLFERMIRNDIQCHTLNVQHRMKPEICNLIRPSIYRSLEDHFSVLDRPDILGIDQSLFFITHNQKEESCGNSSKKNLHEVTFLINLAKYLILNGCKPQNITILAAYLGQMYEMQRERKKYSLILRDVKISVLDNYQGEENEIILLSLVRNNVENKNGFLKVTNRVCVALSRARNALYIMGNMNQLCEDRNSIWLKIKSTLEKQNAIGTSLNLRCQIHNIITTVKNVEDFNKIPEGGCTRYCGADLSCGHVCTNICHLSDRDHKNYTCTETCGRKLCDRSEKHLCDKPCYQKCEPCYYPCRWRLGCDHSVTLKCYIDPKQYDCVELVPTLLPCGHNENKPCHIKADDFSCPQLCDALLDCGHACTLSCHDRKDPDHLKYKCPKPCEKSRNGCSNNKHKCRKLCYEECEPCLVKVKKRRTVCSHVDEVLCNTDVDDSQCGKPCTRILPCGHKCGNKCFEPCGPCVAIIEKIVPECEHKIKIECYMDPKRQHCKENCNRKLSCGHVCQNKCRDECTGTCQVMKTCNMPSPCGHIVKQIKCFERVSANDENLLKYCMEPCQQVLQCNHKCTGVCWQCFQGRIHARCTEKCGVPLVCNHECPIPCREACKPCEKKCNYKCMHGRCTKKCGEVCVKCVEECPRKCIHQTCRLRCGDICDVKPCEMPCPKRLKCGHECVGFCNEPCPKLCRICNRDELTEIIFGTEDEDGARFVELQDCGHVMESSGMETWLNTDNGEIQIKVCPKCKIPIINTQRYTEFVKKAFIDINKVKLKLNGSPEENTLLRIDLLERMGMIKDKATIFSNNKALLLAVGRFEGRLQETKLEGFRGLVKQSVNASVLKYITSKVQIVEHIIDICSRYDSYDSSAILAQIEFLLIPLLRDEEEITIQEIEDVQLEMSRLKRMVEILQINKKLSRWASSKWNENLQNIKKLVTSKKRYSEVTDKEVERKLKNMHCGIKISDSERLEIVMAMKLSKGHWFKCPNGHPYVITECGGAMQESKCPDCGETIGGSQHTLVSSNQLASEMDGAQFAAWSNVANNMGNYDLRQFQFN